MTRPNMVLAVVAGVLALLAASAVVAGAVRQQPTADQSTPEGVVHAFLTAVYEDDEESARALTWWPGECERDLNAVFLPESVRLDVVSSRITGERATVVIDITEEERHGLFDGWSHEETYELVPHGDSWLVSEASWPHFPCELPVPPIDPYPLPPPATTLIEPRNPGEVTG